MWPNLQVREIEGALLKFIQDNTQPDFPKDKFKQKNPMPSGPT
jgi:hypothetical protein